MTTETKPTPWAGFKYEPVRGLVDRHVARFLRTQRKNMRRFFQERGHLDLFAQLDELRKDSRRNFMQKNTTFQRILNEHIARSAPAVAEAPSMETPVGVVDVPSGGAIGYELSGSTVAVVQRDDGIRAQPADSVPGLAQANASDGLVIEE